MAQLIRLTRRSLAQSRMVQEPTLEITHRSDVGLGRALCPKGPLYGRRTMSGGDGPLLEQFVGSYVQQLNKITNLVEIMVEIARGYDHLTLLSFYGDQEDGCPTHLVIAYLCYSAPRQFEDARNTTKVTDRALMKMLGGTS